MPNVTYIDIPRKLEWDFATDMKEFLPNKLNIAKDIINYPYIKQKGFWGFFKGKIADFSGNRTIKIKKVEWKEPILEAVRNYENRYYRSIDVVVDIY
jgi:hypothetical protein